jgi:hypothetical protein
MKPILLAHITEHALMHHSDLLLRFIKDLAGTKPSPVILIIRIFTLHLFIDCLPYFTPHSRQFPRPTIATHSALIKDLYQFMVSMAADGAAVAQRRCTVDLGDAECGGRGR